MYRPLQTHQHYKNQLPVIVFIHGGALAMGSARPEANGPEYFMNGRRVLFVAMAYRLGVLGFLSTGDANAPGNAGFKDQVLAMRWVQRNIGRFGGDPWNVTAVYVYVYVYVRAV